ncbi:chemotaxis protein CheW [bacterium]|nr:chemotaxis protein CheW [bacterium]
MAKNTLPGDTLVLFQIDDKIFGLPLDQVARVERAVKITTVPEAPPSLLGVINNHGSILPVINMRYKTGMSERPIGITDQMIIARCHFYTIVIPVDKVEGVTKAKNVVTPVRLMGKDINMPQLMTTELGIVMVISCEQLISFHETLAIQEIADNLSSFNNV